MIPIFTWPTDSHAVSSGFTDPRWYGQHNGIDIVAPLGALVRAMAGGRVILARAAGSAGLSVWVNHPEGWRSHYCHLSYITVLPGDELLRGDWLGDVGSTGVSTGPHLHLNLFSPTKPPTGLSAYVPWVDKWAVDPLDYLSESRPEREDDMFLILKRSDGTNYGFNGYIARGIPTVEEWSALYPDVPIVDWWEADRRAKARDPSRSITASQWDEIIARLSRPPR